MVGGPDVQTKKERKKEKKEIKKKERNNMVI